MTTNTQFINRVLELTNEHRAANVLNPLAKTKFPLLPVFELLPQK